MNTYFNRQQMVCRHRYFSLANRIINKDNNKNTE